MVKGGVVVKGVGWRRECAWQMGGMCVKGGAMHDKGRVCLPKGGICGEEGPCMGYNEI